MRKLSRLIHSPHHLFTFEVCGRLLSFTRAAEELGVSQPAVSLAMRQLEAALGVSLFKREHRSVSLTERGQKLYEEVSSGLYRIYNVADELRQSSRSRHVTMSISTAFANYWMVPKLSSFHSTHPDIDLRLQVVDKDIDLDEHAVSLGIRNYDHKPKGYHSFRIAKEELLPVASPAYLARMGAPKTLDELTEHFLIHLEEPFRKRATWADWFAGHGKSAAKLPRGIKLNDYALVIQAAIAGEGMALGWRHIVQELLDRNVLNVALDQPWSSGNDTWLIWSQQVELSDHTARVRDWLIESAKLSSSIGELPQK